MKGKTENAALMSSWRARCAFFLHACRQHPGRNYFVLLLIWLIASGLAYYGLSRNLPSAAEWTAWQSSSISPPNEIRCDGYKAADPVSASFNVFVDNYHHALSVAHAFCSDEVFSGQRLDFKVIWGLSEQDSLTHMQRGLADLVFGKPHLIDSYSVRSLQSYELLGFYPFYGSNLISKKELQLSRRSLVGRKVGLLASTKSRSGRLVPESALRDVGVLLGDLVVTHALSHAELRSLLMTDKVDFIASFWSYEDRENFPEWKVLPIGEELPGSGWFIHGRHLGDVYSCAAQRVLQQMSDAAENRYFQSLRLVADDC